ncbi:glycosyltransferase family 2 protein [Rubellimicrobium rubrum]|uniref:Glycosyltransferase family 2 protein n=1 Tax=Rubellimicrobium rubrum TaxID=2585369 RepID=A0A5C4MTE2_9RHOB|nr:glycosyltransferase family 2 protein [Rubellimicrobium rubrum]TNC49149.1 glycosyltransferase family 2 protein [Rubellimicrobium rubrum]
MKVRRAVLGVCTFRRASLERTLVSLIAQVTPVGVETTIVVADNDGTPSARPLVERVAQQTGVPITYLHCPARNISIARNGVLAEAEALGADALAFLDDDEWVGPDWFSTLLATLEHTGADAVFGPISGIHSDEAPGWIRAGRFHDMQPEIDLAGRVRTGHTGNAMVALKTPAFTGRRFDLRFGQSGGEDTEFFAAAKAAGAVLLAAPLALAWEHVPADRANAGWLFRRRFRMGQTHGLLIGRDASPVRRAGLAAVAAAKASACLAMAVPIAYSRERRNRALLRGCLHVGAASSLLGLRSLTLYGYESGATGADVPATPPDRSSS